MSYLVSLMSLLFCVLMFPCVPVFLCISLCSYVPLFFIFHLKQSNFTSNLQWNQINSVYKNIYFWILLCFFWFLFSYVLLRSCVSVFLCVPIIIFYHTLRKKEKYIKPSINSKNICLQWLIFLSVSLFLCVSMILCSSVFPCSCVSMFLCVLMFLYIWIKRIKNLYENLHLSIPESNSSFKTLKIIQTHKLKKTGQGPGQRPGQREWIELSVSCYLLH